MPVTKSTKAALLSALVFPGIGHLALREYLRAAVLAVASIAAVYVITTSAFNQAMSVVDRINSGNIPIDSQALAKAISDASDGAEGRKGDIALIVFGACWLVGIVDSYRLGKAQDDERPAETGSGPAAF